MNDYKIAFMSELRLFKDSVKQDKTLLDKIKRTWFFIYRLHSETDKYTLYWNGKKITSETECTDYFYYHDALDAFKQRLLANTSNYVELVEHKKNKGTNPIIRISV